MADLATPVLGFIPTYEETFEGKVWLKFEPPFGVDIYDFALKQAPRFLTYKGLFFKLSCYNSDNNYVVYRQIEEAKIAKPVGKGKGR